MPLTDDISIEQLVARLSYLNHAKWNQLLQRLQKRQEIRERYHYTDLTIVQLQQFWALIQKIDWTLESENCLQPLIIALTHATIDEIYAFAECLALCLHQLDGPDFMKAFAGTPQGCSADTFLYSRCWVVANGQVFYEKVLLQPENMPTEQDLEELLYVTSAAYEQKTGDPYSYIPTINYESFFNQKLWGDQAIIL